MTHLTFEDILRAAQKLDPQQKALLARSLERPGLDNGPTREALIAELEVLRARGAFDQAASLRNSYAHSAPDGLTEAQLLADIRDAATEWEAERNEFFGDAH